MRYRIRYSRFAGANGDKTFERLNEARIALRDEVADLRAGQGPYGAPWRRASVTEAFPGTPIDQKLVVFDPYLHVSWDPSKPERIWIERFD